MTYSDSTTLFLFLLFYSLVVPPVELRIVGARVHDLVIQQPGFHETGVLTLRLFYLRGALSWAKPSKFWLLNDSLHKLEKGENAVGILASRMQKLNLEPLESRLPKCEGNRLPPNAEPASQLANYSSQLNCQPSMGYFRQWPKAAATALTGSHTS